MKSIEWMAKNPIAANLLMIVLLFGGVFIGTGAKQEVFPEFELDIITVVVPYRGATPSEIEESIILPIEEEIEDVVGIKKKTSNGYEGAGRLTLELEAGEDNSRVLDDVKAAVDGITSFPADAEKPSIYLNRNRREVITVAVHGDVTEQTLRELTEEIRLEFLNNPNITQAELSGVREYEIAIEISQSQLRRYNLTLPQVSNAIREATLDLPGGKLKTSGGDVLIRTKERRYTAAEYGEIPIVTTEEGKVLLKHIASIQDTFEEVDSFATYDGHPAALIEVFRVGDQTPKGVAQSVKDSIEDLENRLPEGISISILDDRSLLLQGRIDLLLENAALGLVLVIILLTLFLRMKLAFWIMMGIPISFLGALFLIPITDVSINMISLFAFILVLGVVVDDAVVVGENIYAHQQMGKPGLQAAIEGAHEISGPVLFAILTTLAAFLPFFFVVGTTGKFFGVIPVIVYCVLIISLIECLYILPAHLVHTSKPHAGVLGKLEHVQDVFDGFLQRFIRGPYAYFLEKAIAHRYATLSFGIATILLGAGMVAGGHIKFTFFPKIDSDRVIANLSMPFGTPAHVTEKAQAQVAEAAEDLIAEYNAEKGVDVAIGVFARLGGSAGFGGGSNSHSANVLVFLKGLDVRGFPARDFANKWRQRIGEIPGVESLNIRFSIGPGSGADLTVRLIHPDFNALEKISARVKTILEEYPGVSDIEDSYAEGKPEIQLQLKPEGNSLGLTADDLTQQVRAAFQGLEVLRLQREDNEVKVMLRYPLEERRYLRDLEDLIVRTPDGGEIPLSHVAILQNGLSFSEINRVDGKRIVDVTASVDSKAANTGEIVQSLRTEVLPQLVADYPALEFSFAGSQRDRSESMASLRDGFKFALGLIVVLLALQFKSYFQPLVVMLAIPFGIVGALIGHMIMGYDLSIVSIMGVIALSGIVVNDSLILVDFVNKGRESGLSMRDAVIQAGMRRFRPIMLTSLTTFFGLLPMIFETSVQARFLIPMAISLGFGVMFATFITLLLIPALYLILEDILGPFRRLFGKPQTSPSKTSEETKPAGTHPVPPAEAPKPIGTA